jgi:hypothetical protein
MTQNMTQKYSSWLDLLYYLQHAAHGKLQNGFFEGNQQKKEFVLTCWSDWKDCQSLDKQSHSDYTLTNPCHHVPSPPQLHHHHPSPHVHADQT